MDLEDAPQFAVLAIPKPSLTLDDDQIVPQTQDFATIGHLYRGIEQGLRHLVEKYGERGVFIGPPRAQATQEYFGWPELIAVTDLASACQAIETIIEEGEGARGDWRQAHFGKFLQIMQEYRDLKQQDPGFEPGRPVVAAYMRPGKTFAGWRRYWNHTSKRARLGRPDRKISHPVSRVSSCWKLQLGMSLKGTRQACRLRPTCERERSAPRATSHRTASSRLR